LVELSEDNTEYRKICDSSVIDVSEFKGHKIISFAPEVLENLTFEAFKDISHLLRPAHLAQLSEVLKDKEASDNERFVALQLLKNACIASGSVLPLCQDTGTAIVHAHKGGDVFTAFDNVKAIENGIEKAYKQLNLRYSQNYPLSMFEEVNSGSNLPAQIEIEAGEGGEYELLFMAKGGGSANKSYLFQETKAILNPEKLIPFLREKIISLGTSACPPYHLAIVIGGTSAEYTMKNVKLASAKYLDNLPTKGGVGVKAYRDLELEQQVLGMTRSIAFGGQYGGKYFCLDVRVIRLSRHGASLPVGIGVSCVADRQIKAKINKDGVFLEKLETNPAKYLPEVREDKLSDTSVSINLDKPMAEILVELSKHPVKTRLSLNGTIIVARDIAHARFMEEYAKTGKLPEYIKNHPIYYAGPAKKPDNMPSGSFGPTTAGRMDSYVAPLQENGASMIMIAKGNRSKAVKDACQKYGGFYLGTIGGAAAIVAQDSIKSVEVVDYADLGMEAVWKIKVENFPAFIVIDDKGGDFFAGVK